MGAHQDPLQRAVVGIVAVMCALLNGAFDALIGIDIHCDILLFYMMLLLSPECKKSCKKSCRSAALKAISFFGFDFQMIFNRPSSALLDLDAVNQIYRAAIGINVPRYPIGADGDHQGAKFHLI